MYSSTYVAALLFGAYWFFTLAMYDSLELKPFALNWGISMIIYLIVGFICKVEGW